MGALIMTKGTKRLAAHYNDEFDTWIDFYRDPTVLARFNRAGIDVWSDLVQTIKDASTTNDHTDRPDDLTLLPKKNNRHANLEARWKYFLQRVLTPANNTKLANLIHAALTAAPANRYIVFDVRVGARQDILLAPDFDDGDPIARLTIIVAGALPVTSLDKDAELPDLDP